MSFEKRNYISGQTVITAKNLNEIQDAIITLERNGGVTPHIGENGNWYIGSTDTGKPSRGEKGDPGAAGKTPVKGTDYWTAADKAEMVADVLAALPDGTEVAY